MGAARSPVEILATDLDTQVLEEGRRGIYAAERLEAIDPRLRDRYFEPLADGRWQIRAELHALVRFARLNFVETPWPVQGPFEAIFCRNVLIYFDRHTQRMILERFAPLLRPGGYLYLGHSENLLYASEAFEPLGRTIYRRKADGEAAAGGSIGLLHRRRPRRAANPGCLLPLVPAELPFRGPPGRRRPRAGSAKSLCTPEIR